MIHLALILCRVVTPSWIIYIRPLKVSEAEGFRGRDRRALRFNLTNRGALRVVRYLNTQGSILTAYFSLHIQLFGTAYCGGACILTAAGISEFWEEVARVSRRHSGLVLTTAVANLLSTHILFNAHILPLILILHLHGRDAGGEVIAPTMAAHTLTTAL